MKNTFIWWFKWALALSFILTLPAILYLGYKNYDQKYEFSKFGFISEAQLKTKLDTLPPTSGGIADLEQGLVATKLLEADLRKISSKDYLLRNTLFIFTALTSLLSFACLIGLLAVGLRRIQGNSGDTTLNSK